MAAAPFFTPEAQKTQKNTKQQEQEFIKKENKPHQDKIPQLTESEKKLEIVYKKAGSFDHKAYEK